ncbi:SURF1 family protein [Salipiger mucosus]|uniref:SURF1-like protein n=1 Tax=Salipiger mucosus DSM 16094 TaxID=1123237 RepID=S9RXS1_9RHOB|nr:SURF1 family protein [Salipiger mucosus]EPX78789.1 Cytochrome oxidase biogenesis protein Surf1, facilitates heme A insertion [Salipiger mucosus DSM 16094]
MTRYLAPLLFGLIGAAILVGLGTWQVQRLGEKEGILAEREALIHGAPQPLPRTIAPEEQRYRPVELSGEILPGALRVLVSRKQIGPGYLVVSPFRTDDGRLLLLDRGFTPVDNRDLAPRSGPAQVTGNLHWPDERNASTPQNDIAGNTWFARDIGPMAEELGTEPLLVVARKITPADAAIEPLPVDTSNIPNDHLQYAITWFSLAVVWLGMTAYWIWRRATTRET